MCSTKRAMTGLAIGSHRAGYDGGGKRKRCPRKKKPCHHDPSAFSGVDLGYCRHHTEIGVGMPRAMAAFNAQARNRLTISRIPPICGSSASRISRSMAKSLAVG
jgi:hypothetical protein